MIFLSYAGEHGHPALELACYLKERRVDVWCDRLEGALRPGDVWVEVLQERLSRCTHFLLLVGSGPMTAWVKMEVDVAIRRHVTDRLRIVPLLLPGARPENLPEFLRGFQALTLQTRPSSDQGR